MRPIRRGFWLSLAALTFVLGLVRQFERSGVRLARGCWNDRSWGVRVSSRCSS